MIDQINKAYERTKSEHMHRAQGDLLIDCSCIVYDGFVTFVGISKGKDRDYHTTIYAGKFEGAKCDCDGYKILKRCKHILALAMWAKGER